MKYANKSSLKTYTKNMNRNEKKPKKIKKIAWSNKKACFFLKKKKTRTLSVPLEIYTYTKNMNRNEKKPKKN